MGLLHPLGHLSHPLCPVEVEGKEAVALQRLKVPYRSPWAKEVHPRPVKRLEGPGLGKVVRKPNPPGQKEFPQ